jgi:magnesium transporter
MKQKRIAKKGMPPGTVIFTGEQQSSTADFRYVVYNENHVKEENLTTCPLSNVVTPVENENIWYDLKGVQQVELIEQLGTTFNIHPLVLEDIANTTQRPKFEEYETGNFLVLQNFKFNTTTMRFSTEQISIFFNQNTVISFQEDAEELFLNVVQQIASGKGKIRIKKADYLTYNLLDTIVDNYIEILETVEEKITALEIEVTHNPQVSLKSAIYQLKRELLTFRKSLNSLREAIIRMMRSENDFINDYMSHFLRDLLDHITHLLERTENFREMLSEIQNLYLAEIGFKANGVIQVLTIVSSIFIPLTFIAGLYGMNFKYMPELEWTYGYPAVLFFMATTACILLLYFHRKRWI